LTSVLIPTLIIFDSFKKVQSFDQETTQHTSHFYTTKSTVRLSITELLTQQQTATSHDSTSFCLLYLAAALSNAAEVQFVTIAARPLPFNYRGRSICQTAEKGHERQNSIYTAMGLNGFKQVVGISDTGKSHQCFCSTSSVHNSAFAVLLQNFRSAFAVLCNAFAAFL
jgi:hypothetical protein